MMASHKPMLITTTTKLLDAIRVIHDSIHIRPRTTLQASWRPPVAARTFVASFRLPNHELFDLVPGLESGRKPTRLLPAPRPGFGRLLGISIFGEYARVLPPLARRASRVRRFRLAQLFLAPKLSQPLLELAFFRR